MKRGDLGGPALREETHFWVIEVLTRSTLVPALGEKRRSIPPLDASFSVFSQAQRFTGHNLEQLLGSEFMVIVGKWNHTNVEFHGPHQMFPKKKSVESGCFPLYTNTSTALDMAVYKIQLKLLCNDRDQHLQTKRNHVQLPITYGNDMQIICISWCIFVPYVRFNQCI